MVNNIISINVGGTIYTTTKSTLTKEPESMLARMVNTEVPTEKDPSGNIFIDRDPQAFSVILKFLRTDHLIMENSACSMKELEVEADYFMLDRLLQVIRPDAAGMRDKESCLRQEKKYRTKEPLNAFMIYMKEMRLKIIAECRVNEPAGTINQILGRRVSYHLYFRSAKVIKHNDLPTF